MMRIKVSKERVFVRLTALLLLCALLLTGCIGQKSQSFLTGVADILSMPYQSISASASFILSQDAGAQYGGLLPREFTLSAEGSVAENLSKYNINIYIKQPGGKQEALLNVFGSGGDMYIQAKSYSYLLPELLYYKEYINSFEHEQLKAVFESGKALEIKTSSLLSFLTDDNRAVLFLEELLEDHSGLNYSTLYTSLCALASESVDGMEGALTPSVFGAGWVRFKADSVALSSAITGALEQMSEYAGKVSESLEDFLALNRSSFSAAFLEECQLAKQAGGVVPDFDLYEEMRFDILLQDTADTAEGLKELSRSLSEKVSENKAREDETGIKSSSEITLSSTSDKFSLMVSTAKKQNAKVYMSSELKLTVSRGIGFTLPSVQSAELSKVLWEAARDYYKSEEHKAVFLRLDYSSMTATVTTASQEVHSYPIEGITQDYFNSVTHGGTDTPENAAIVPVRLACEVFGEDVLWDSASNKAYIERMSGEGVKKLYISGNMCGDKLFTSVKELYKLGLVFFGDDIYNFELAK